MTAREQSFLLVLARRIVPGSGVDRRLIDVVEAALASRPPEMVRQLRLFLRVLRWLPLPRYGAPFERLPPERQDAFLSWLQDCPVALLRKGFWGVRTLVLMGHYGRPEIGPTLCYTPSRSGNDLLGHA